MSDDQQDWRLRVDLADASTLHQRLRDAHHFERELEPLISSEVALSYDDGTLFAYANTRAAIDEVRSAVEHQLSSDGLTATATVISHWDDDLGEVGEWHQVDPPGDAAERGQEAGERAEHVRALRPETRTVAITAGRWVRNWFETTVADEAREAGVKLEIVEHPHLLTTQIAFTLSGPTENVEGVIADLRSRALQVTRLETFPL